MVFSQQDHMLTVAVALMVKAEHQAKPKQKQEEELRSRHHLESCFFIGCHSPIPVHYDFKEQQTFLGDSQARIKIAGRNTSNLKYADNIYIWIYTCMYNSPSCCSKCLGWLCQKLLVKRTYKSNILFKCYCVYIYIDLPNF